MLEHDALRKVLFTQAIAAVTANGNFPCQIGNEAFVPPDAALYGEFWFRTTDSEQLELGSPTGYERTPGLLQFTLYAPEKDGDGPVLKLAGGLKKAFNRKQWIVAPDGYVTLRPASVKEMPGIRNGKKVVIVDCHFDFFHHDPTAT
jgi:hypothetical protein